MAKYFLNIVAQLANVKKQKINSLKLEKNCMSRTEMSKIHYGLASFIFLMLLSLLWFLGLHPFHLPTPIHKFPSQNYFTIILDLNFFVFFFFLNSFGLIQIILIIIFFAYGSPLFFFFFLKK